jgi:hypothetical protein
LVEFDPFAFAEEILRPTREMVPPDSQVMVSLQEFQEAIHKGIKAVQEATTFHAREKLRHELTKALRARRSAVLACVSDHGEREVMAEETLEAQRASNAVAMAFL